MDALARARICQKNPRPTVLAPHGNVGVGRAETLYVGDSDVDIATARNAGLECASVTWGFCPRETMEAAGAARFFADAQALAEYILA